MLVIDESKKTVHLLSNKMEYPDIFVTAAGKLECPRCKTRSYVDRHGLFRHLRHECGIEREFPWTVCKKIIIKHQLYLERHIKNIHDMERRFSCTECTKLFKQKVHLQRHIKNVHVMERRFPCSLCKKYI